MLEEARKSVAFVLPSYSNVFCAPAEFELSRTETCILSCYLCTHCKRVARGS